MDSTEKISKEDNEFKVTELDNSNVIDYAVHQTNYNKDTWRKLEDVNKTGNYSITQTGKENNFDSSSTNMYNESRIKLDNDDSPRGDEMQIDTYLKEIKDDLREREARNEKRFSDIVDYTRDRDDKFRNEMKEREDRFIDSTKEREERIQKSIDELKQSFEATKSDNKSTKIAIWTLSISTIIGIAGMIVAILIGS